jgi:muramoyltetrapeptide carboxypeptidase LdcA involved in peptidoglycan recycling
MTARVERAVSTRVSTGRPTTSGLGRELLLPRALRRGAHLRVVSPSYPLLADVPHRAARARRALEGLGFEVSFSREAHGRWGHLSAPPDRRARDLEEAFMDDDVDGILSSFGASIAADVLPELDLDVVRENPKPLIGRSDNVTLLLGLLAKVGLVSFYGVSFLDQFGEAPAPHEPTVQSFLDACARPGPSSLRPVGPRTFAYRKRREPSDDARMRELDVAGGWRWLKPGRASGPLIGGELTSLMLLLDTEWLPDLDGALLFWDAVSVSAVTVEWALHELARRGVTASCAGMIVGIATRIRPTPGAPGVEEILARDLVEMVPGPILVCADCGHADPVWTLPLGVQASLDSERDLFTVAGAVRP